MRKKKDLAMNEGKIEERKEHRFFCFSISFPFFFFLFFLSIIFICSSPSYFFAFAINRAHSSTDLRRSTTGSCLGFLNHVTMMCGADNRTVMVAMMVNRVKMIRHILSITIAANFQSFVTFVFSSSFFN